jgi:hypothetical protein
MSDMSQVSTIKDTWFPVDMCGNVRDVINVDECAYTHHPSFNVKTCIGDLIQSYHGYYRFNDDGQVFCLCFISSVISR